MRLSSDTDYLYLFRVSDASLTAFIGIALRFGSLFLLLDIGMALDGCATFCVMSLFCHYLANLLRLGWQINTTSRWCRRLLKTFQVRVFVLMLVLCHRQLLLMPAIGLFPMRLRLCIVLTYLWLHWFHVSCSSSVNSTFS